MKNELFKTMDKFTIKEQLEIMREWRTKKKLLELSNLMLTVYYKKIEGGKNEKKTK